MVKKKRTRKLKRKNTTTKSRSKSKTLTSKRKICTYHRICLHHVKEVDYFILLLLFISVAIGLSYYNDIIALTVGGLIMLFGTLIWLDAVTCPRRHNK